MICKACRDTGVIETGDNDEPCRCAAGDKALFNVSTVGGLRQVTGAEIKRRGARAIACDGLPSTAASE